MVASEQHLYQTIVLPRKLATGSIHDYIFWHGLLVGILFKGLRILTACNCILTFKNAIINVVFMYHECIMLVMSDVRKLFILHWVVFNIIYIYKENGQANIC